jgi:LAGLIDADG endonuclease
VGSENPTGADDQQETADFVDVLDPMWIVGFVDGEGCSSVTVHRSRMMERHGGWQLQPAFQVYQHVDHREVLEAIASFFGCGRVRPKGPKSSVLTYSVEGLAELAAAVLPFFERHPLLVKGGDVRRFSEIVRSMCAKEHLAHAGFERLVRIAYGVNANGKQRSRSIEEVLAGSSETGRGASTLDAFADLPSAEGERRRRYSPTLMATWGAGQK